MRNSLINEVDLWGFEDGIACFKDYSLGFGFKLNPLDISCASDDEINAIKSKCKIMLGSLPTGVDIQFLQVICKSGLEDLDKHLGFAKASSDIVKVVAEERFSKFSNLSDIGALVQQKNYVLVRVPFAEKINPIFGMLNFNIAQNREVSEKKLAAGLRAARTIQLEIERNITAANFSISRLEPKEIIDLAFDVWNPEHPIGIGEFDESNITNRLIMTDLVKEIKGFRFGDIHHRVISLKMLPEQTFAGMASALMDLPVSSSLSVSIHVPDQEKEIEWLKLNRRMAYAMVIGKKGVSDLESEAKFQDVEELLSAMVKDAEKILYCSLSVILRSKSELELDSQVSHVLQCIRDLSGSEGFLETYAAFDIFASSSVPNARNKERLKRVKSSNVSDLIPVFGQWRGFERPSVLLRTTLGSLFKFDPFSPSLTNANQIISGGSGSGKSYLTNLMIGQMLSQNPRVFILDVGGSYQKTCKLLNGQYIPLSMGVGLSMNPFDRLDTTAEVSDEKVKFLTALVQIMTKEDDQKGVGKLEKAEIERCIQKVYQERPRPKLSDLRELLICSEIIEVKRIGQILSLWCGDSPYGKFLDRETNVSFDKRIVCFDLKGLESNPDLQSSVLFTITDLVWREVQKNRTEMKFLVFDECWRLLENDAGSQFVGEVFRTFRKYYASAIAISQNIDDFAKSKAANAILPNASIKWVLRQHGADFKRLAEVLRLNEREISQVQSLTQLKGEYSEAFLMCEDRRAVVSVESTPLEYWLATTDPRDFVLLKGESEVTGKEGIALIQHLAKNYPTGATSVA